MISYLLDSNQLLYPANPGAPQYASTREAIRLLSAARQPAFVVPQTLTEFWRGATRPIDPDVPGRSGLGMTAARADAEVNFLRNNFTFLPGTPAIFEEWQKIALAYEVRSAKVHDARLVAVMVVYGIDGVLTHNTQDFKRYLHIQAVHPDELPALLRAEGAASSPNGTGNG